LIGTKAFLSEELKKFRDKAIKFKNDFITYKNKKDEFLKEYAMFIEESKRPKEKNTKTLLIE